MKEYWLTLTCDYCGVYMGFIEVEDIERPHIKDIQCSNCEQKEQ